MSRNNSMSKIQIQKDLSTWDWEDVHSWLMNNNMQKYVDNFQRFAINGYDMCYLTNDDLNEMKLTNFHDRNLILKNVRLMTLEQLKIQVTFDEKSIIVQLDFDPNFSSETLAHSLAEIFKIQSTIYILTMDNEVLMPNLKIVELILLHPSKYKMLKLLTPNSTDAFAKDFTSKFKYEKKSQSEEEHVNRNNYNEGYSYEPKFEKKDNTSPAYLPSSEYIPLKERMMSNNSDLITDKDKLYGRPLERERLTNPVDKQSYEQPASVFSSRLDSISNPTSKNYNFTKGEMYSFDKTPEYKFSTRDRDTPPINKVGYGNALGNKNIDGNIDLPVSKEDSYNPQRFSSEKRNFRINADEKSDKEEKGSTTGIGKFDQLEKLDKLEKEKEKIDSKANEFKYYEKFSDFQVDNFNERFNNNNTNNNDNSKFGKLNQKMNQIPVNPSPNQTTASGQVSSATTTNYELKNKVNNIRNQLNNFGNLNSSLERKNITSGLNDDPNTKNISPVKNMNLKYNNLQSNSEPESENPNKLMRNNYGGKSK